MTKNELIKNYLNDEDLLYQTWYKKNIQSEFGDSEEVEYHGIIPSKEEILEYFWEQYKINKEKIYKLVCIEFEKLRTKNDYKTAEQMIIALSALFDGIIAASLELATILYHYGLDKICTKKV